MNNSFDLLPNPRSPQTAAEWIGLGLGFTLGVGTGLLSWVRQARGLHPSGLLFRARVRPSLKIPSTSQTKFVNGMQELARELEGSAWVRLSAALWKVSNSAINSASVRGSNGTVDVTAKIIADMEVSESALPDVLGVAIRFFGQKDLHNAFPGEEAESDAQDLLFATIRETWTMPFAPLTTDQHRFSNNLYFAVAPFYVVGLGLVKFRLTPLPSPSPPLEGPKSSESRVTRASHIRAQVLKGEAQFKLEVSAAKRPYQWQELVLIELQQEIKMGFNSSQPKFSAFRSECGIYPRGFVQFLRVGAYRCSQMMRPNNLFNE